MAKKSKGNRVQVILECTEHKNNTPERLELKKFNPILKKVTVHKEIK
jgi:large subunit ribosomal protein L33